MPPESPTNPAWSSAVRLIPSVARTIRSFVLPIVPGLGRIYWKTQPFHSDEHWKRLVKTMLGKLPVTSAVETGTNRGDSTCFLADHFAGPVYTCEIMGLYYRESRHRFRTYQNISITRGSSPPFLEALVNEEKLGELPFFFLDAHWYDYWPLHGELAVVESVNKAILMIDDFEVPGRPSFGYDVYVERNNSGVEIRHSNNLNFINHFLNRSRHRILFPDYEVTEAGARGHIVIFQDAEEEFEAMINDPIIASDYKEYRLE